MPPKRKRAAATKKDDTKNDKNGTKDAPNGDSNGDIEPPKRKRGAAVKKDENGTQDVPNGDSNGDIEPPKRKRGAAAKKDENGSADVPNGSDSKGDVADKKMILVPLNVKFTWQVKEKSGWVTYSPETCEALTQASQQGIAQTEFEAGPRTKLTLDINEMKQIGKSDEKDIRCLIENTDGDFVFWGLESGRSFQPGIVSKITKMSDISSTLTIDGWKYDLDNLNRTKENSVENIKTEIIVPAKFKKTGSTGKLKPVSAPALQVKSGTAAAANGNGVSASAAVDNDEDDDPPATKKSKKSTAAKKSGKKKQEAVEEVEEEKPRMKSVVKKGLAPVDAECPYKDSFHVYTEGSDIWDVMLNQTNIQNNNNKYYLIQLLESDSGKQYRVWMRWGRIGYTSQTSSQQSPSLDNAKGIFTKKFKDKTKNDWEDRADFEKVNGKYDLVHMDYSSGGKEEDEVDSKLSLKQDPEVKKDIPASKLESQVQELIKLICDIGTMEQTVVEMEYDTKKAPLGKITTEQIKAGYEALKRVSECIDKGKTSGGEITQACSDFYTRIPHEFGFRVPPIIKTHADVKKKIGLLEALSDIQVALKMLSSLTDDNVNPIDARYEQLKVDIQALAKDSSERQIIEESIQTTQGPTHGGYSMDVLEVFKLHKQNEHDNFLDVGNKKLLFHGSRLSNWAGILGQGLRIAPPEAPVTGYMFGKGVYFADCSSKSANYCFTTRSNNIGLMLICEVSLGKQNKLVHSDYHADRMPAGCNSVLGTGKLEPSHTKDLGDCVIPTGKTKNTGVSGSGFILQYNEFIVYNTSQIKMKYLAKIKFNHKY